MSYSRSESIPIDSGPILLVFSDRTRRKQQCIIKPTSLTHIFGLAFVLAVALAPIAISKSVPLVPSEYDQVKMRMQNNSSCTLHIYWINPDNREPSRMTNPALEPGEKFELQSFEGHEFEIRNVHGKCCGTEETECRRLNNLVLTGDPVQLYHVNEGIDVVLQESSGDQERKSGRTRITRHAKMNAQSFVDLHNLDIEENKNLNLGVDNPAEAATQVMDRITSSIHERMTKVFEKAKTPECRALIGEHFGYFLNAFGKELSFPFADIVFENQCDEEKYDFDNLPENMHFGHIQNRTYQPPPDEAEYIDDPANLNFLYALMTHDDAASTIRLIEALYEAGHVFVIHVDGKESSDEVHDRLVEYASTRQYVHVLPHPYRVRVNWGGFTMVNATLQMLKYAFAIDHEHNDNPLDFHKVIHLASTTYPIASKTEIRRRIASYPLDANMMHVIMKPTMAHPHAWHYFVECDDAVHRIYRLEPMNGGIQDFDLYTSSQWFVISREFAEYIAAARPGTLVHEFLEYAQHVVVADETFFGTLLRNTVYCHKHHNWNWLHLQFDRWESDLEHEKRDERKCMMPDPNHCGRSPTTMTMDYLDVLELSEDLFARKFLDGVDSKIKDVLDLKREREERKFAGGDEPEKSQSVFDYGFAGHGVLIVAKETLNDEMPLCLGLGESGNKMRLVPCFYDAVLPTLAPGWETGAVIIEETKMTNRWALGPCSTDGVIERMPNAEMQMTPGLYSPIGPRCMLKQVDGIRQGRCLDGESERTQPGGNLQVYPCVRKWHQFVSFGNGTLAPSNSMHTTIPRHIVKRIQEAGKEQEPYLCVGVQGRGSTDEDDWEEDRTFDENEQLKRKDKSRGDETTDLPPLSEWRGEQVVTTRCTNIDAVIQWLFVPYIVEDEDDKDSVDETVADPSEHEL